jgi:hypothetical protein
MKSDNLIAIPYHNLICEAVGCYSKTTTKVKVKVGSEKIILLFLRDMCEPKFRSERRWE